MTTAALDECVENTQCTICCRSNVHTKICLISVMSDEGRVPETSHVVITPIESI